MPPGSSPLARGLPRGLLLYVGVKGIIPARAGFTPGLCLGGRRVRDHPRSRGVYRVASRVAFVCLGSSPLARGLPHGGRPRRRRRRIIPARAGFTRRHGCLSVQCEDHPRSRGVYSWPVRATRRRSGSSPLARGLRPATHWVAGPFRIIPARAGFTGGRVASRRASRDHPRSRGVYTQCQAGGR